MSRKERSVGPPFGLRDDKMWAVTEVANGLACACVCLGCGQPLIAKNHGKKRTFHFAHSVDSDCQGAFESSIHRRAKELVAEKCRLLLPAWNESPHAASDDEGHWHYGRRVDMPAKMVALVDARLEISMGGYVPDVVATEEDGDLLIEICVTHAVDDLKTRKVRADGHRMLEINLSKLRRDQPPDPDDFERLVLNTHDNRIWISHPPAEEDWRRSRDELIEVIRERNKAIADASAAAADQLKRKVRLATLIKAQAEARDTQTGAQEKEQDSQSRTEETNHAFKRSKCRKRFLRALARLEKKTSEPAINGKYNHMLRRDEAEAEKTISQITEKSVKKYLRRVPPQGWVYNAHPCLWQAGAYVDFIETQQHSHRFGRIELYHWVRNNYGMDDWLRSLFEAQNLRDHDALGSNQFKPWREAWFFTETENQLIPNFYAPLDEFLLNMVRCGVLTHDPERPNWLIVTATPRIADTSAALVGKIIWHEGLGVCVITDQIGRSGSLYNVRLEDGQYRKLLLQNGHADWRLVEQPAHSDGTRKRLRSSLAACHFVSRP